MRPGDHICVGRGPFMDHGIYINQEQVIHLSGAPLQDSRSSVICGTTLDEFAPRGWNSWVGVVEHSGQPHFSYVDVVERARSQLGRHPHDLDDATGEHFATWCATGDAVSDHVGEARTVATAQLTRS